MADISVFGLEVVLRASVTFPAGFSITQFADDSDPVDFPSMQIGDKAMGVNGDLVSWTVAQPIVLTLSVIADSTDDKNLSILFEANRASKGKRISYDILTATVIYPDGSRKTLANGKITDGIPASSATSAGRKKSKTYTFAFESIA